MPFRSVASRLVRGGAEQMPGLDLDVLRPATYPRLAQVLHEAADAGRPYHVVHFDGHGTYLDLTTLDDHHWGRQTTAPEARLMSATRPVVAAVMAGWGCRRCGMGSRWRGRCGPGSTATCCF